MITPKFASPRLHQADLASARADSTAAPVTPARQAQTDRFSGPGGTTDAVALDAGRSGRISRPALPTGSGAAHNAALSSLSPAQHQRIEALLSQRLAAAPIKVVNPDMQQPAAPERVYELRKNGCHYRLTPTVAGAAIPALQGPFNYVILADDPGRIYLSVPQGSTVVDGEQFGVQGHTSMTQRKDVLYAGGIEFDQGKLISWGNSSGHYRPDQQLRQTNLLPSVNIMLPDEKFIDYWHGLTQAQQDAFLVMRGYAVPPAPRPVEEHHAGERVAAGVDVADRVRLDGARVEEIFKGGGGDAAVAALLELSSARTVDAPLIAPDTSRPWIAAMNRQLSQLKGIEARGARPLPSNPITCLLPGGGAVRHLGTGLQAFGVYTAVRSIGNAIARGDKVDAAIGSAGLAAQAGSLGLEAGLPRLGSYLGKGNIEAFNTFARTPLGVRLGGQLKLGKNVGHAASSAGVALTLPFDIYSAVNAFRQAGATEGKQRQDHYVDGGFAVGGAATSIGLAGAAVAGLSAAGPIGIAVGAALAGANHLYHSIRYVEDIERYAPLSHGQRFVTGFSGFFGGAASQPIQDRVSVGQARERYGNAKRDQLLSYLQGSTHGHAIFGDAVIQAQRPISTTETKTALAAGGPYIYQVTTVVQRPAIVRDNVGDDHIDASDGLRDVKNLVANPSPADASVLWTTGGGNDILKGDLYQSNDFDVRTGIKHMTGGKMRDRFDLMDLPQPGSVFDGGGDHDTLALHFASTLPSAPSSEARTQAPSVRVTLPTGTGGNPVVLVPTDIPGAFHEPTPGYATAPGGLSPEPKPGALDVAGQRSTLRNIENVVTSSSTRTAVTGNRQDNVIVLNGDGDSARGGGGKDIFVVNGGGRINIAPGRDYNRYVIGAGTDQVEIDNAHAAGGKHHLQLDIDIGNLSVVAAGAALEIRLDGKQAGGRRVVLGEAFAPGQQGRNTARMADGDVVITTRDGYLVTPTLSSIGDHPDGMIALVAMVNR